MKLSSSLSTLIGEWVALQKSPDARISSQSSSDIRQAIVEEKRDYMQRMKETVVATPRSRCASETHALDFKKKAEIQIGGSFRDSSKRRTAERPHSMIERIRGKISPSREKDIIDEEDEASGDCSRKCSTIIPPSPTLKIVIS